MGAQVKTIIATGISGTLIDVECHLSNNLPTIIIVGFANKAVTEARERIRGAFADSHIMLPRKRITINLAPADLPKEDSGFDVAIAVAILRASGQAPDTAASKQAFIGELGLDGTVRGVRGIIGKLLAGRANGIKEFYIPDSNLRQALLVPGVTLFPVKTLQQLHKHLIDLEKIKPRRTGKGKLKRIRDNRLDYPVQLSQVVGQEQAKRALEIAAAGGHNVFFSGPPGTGKSMLAKALASLMPLLEREEVLEVTHLHSLASHDYEQIVLQRPFRAPHHSASYAAVTGGGLQLRPGEISLAHRGVLFFDELPEFGRTTLEALRQPLEDRVISVARAKDTIEYPADFMLVATANPCPCGYYGTNNGVCRCSGHQIINYRRRLSGPILDRIDLFSSVHEVAHAKLLQPVVNQAFDDEVRERIQQARQLQAKRYQTPSKLNAAMTNTDINRFARLEKAATDVLNTAAQQLNVSARSYMRSVKVARTIADLEGSEQITVAHISEALAYRRPHAQNS